MCFPSVLYQDFTQPKKNKIYSVFTLDNYAHYDMLMSTRAGYPLNINLSSNVPMSAAEGVNGSGREASEEIRNNVQRASEIFDSYSNMIRAMIRSFVKVESDVDDIYQNLFLSFVRRPMPSNMLDIDIRRYLYRAIRNDVLDASRQAKNRQAQIGKYAQWHTLCTCCEAQKGPEVIVARTEEIRKIFQITEDQLPLHEAEAIAHRYRHDRSTRDAARIMRVKQRTFSRYLCVGLRRVRNFFNTVDEDFV